MMINNVHEQIHVQKEYMYGLKHKSGICSHMTELLSLYKAISFETLHVYLYVSLLVYEQVFRLQISVDKIKRVKVFKGQNYLGGVESGMRLTAPDRDRQTQRKYTDIMGPANMVTIQE